MSNIAYQEYKQAPPEEREKYFVKLIKYQTVNFTDLEHLIEEIEDVFYRVQLDVEKGIPYSPEIIEACDLLTTVATYPFASDNWSRDYDNLHKGVALIKKKYYELFPDDTENIRPL